MMESPSSRLHEIRGDGLPVALHDKVASSPSTTDMSVLVSLFKMSGETVKMISKLLKMALLRMIIIFYLSIISGRIENE